VLDVVTTHFIESLLRLNDEGYEVQHDETVVDGLEGAEILVFA
jgi:hypothetical protein